MGGRTRALVLFATAGVLAGCGGSGGDRTACGDFDACGGDVTGTWSVQALCGTETVSIPGCSSEVTLALDGIEASGTRTFNADMTFAEDSRLSGFAVMHWPNAC